MIVTTCLDVNFAPRYGIMMVSDNEFEASLSPIISSLKIYQEMYIRWFLSLFINP